MKTPRDKSYLEFVRSKPCIVSESEYGVVAHHCRYAPHGGGMGLKPSDYRCVPLNQFYHRKLHDQGEKSFWQDHGICPEVYMADMLKEWLEARYALHVPQVYDYDTAVDYIASVERFLVNQV